LDLVGSGWIWLDLVGSGWIWLYLVRFVTSASDGGLRGDG
jgi:hypothetical protein